MPEISKHQLPSLEVLFKQSWELFKACFFKLLTLFGIMIGVYFLVAVFLALAILIFGLSVSLNNPTNVLSALLSPTVLTSAGLTGLILIIGLTYLNILLQIAVLKVVYEGKDHTSVIQTIKDSRAYVWPVFLVSLLTSLITFGGFMLLVIPGIVFSLLLSFAQYEVIFHHQKPLESLRRSFALFATDFWGIFGRIMLFVLISIIATSIVGSSTGKSSGPLLVWFVNTFLGWFGIAYSLTIYKELRQAHPNLPGKNIKGLVISAGIGFALAFIFLSAGINLVMQYKDSLFGAGMSRYETEDTMAPGTMQWDNRDEIDSMNDYDNPDGYQFKTNEEDSTLN